MKSHLTPEEDAECRRLVAAVEDARQRQDGDATDAATRELNAYLMIVLELPPHGQA